MNPNTAHPSLPQAEADRWLGLAARYFDAATTEAEEEALCRFLASPEGADSRFDEVRAVMAYAACGRASLASAAASQPQPAGRRTVALRRRWAAAAAVVAVVLVGGTGLVHHVRHAAAADVCVAYVGGERVTDAARVDALMREAVAGVVDDGAAASVESQLGDMFFTLGADTPQP